MNQNEILASVITGLIVIVVPIIVKKALALMNAKIDELQKKSHNAQLNAYIDKTQVAVSNAVTFVSQTYVDAIKKSSGGLSASEQREALSNAILTAKCMITKEGRNAIEEAYGDFDTYIETSIENYVKLYRE